MTSRRLCRSCKRSPEDANLASKGDLVYRFISDRGLLAYHYIVISPFAERSDSETREWLESSILAKVVQIIRDPALGGSSRLSTFFQQFSPKCAPFTR